MDKIEKLTSNEFQIISDLIEKVTSHLFKNNIQDMLNDVISIIEKAQNIKESLDNDEQLLINQIMQYISIAMENKDYLLISDMLTYEMLPVIKKLSERSGLNDDI